MAECKLIGEVMMPYLDRLLPKSVCVTLSLILRFGELAEDKAGYKER
jgi:hypothetical protein